MERLFKSSVLIEGVAATEAPDSVGESLNIDGADTSELNNGFINADHDRKFSSLLGRVIDSKKIYSKDDCSTPFQQKEWERLKRPYLWIKGEIWDDPAHKEAAAVAAIYRHYTSQGLPAPIRLSVEGKTLERSGRRLMRTKIKGVAATVVPCNKETSTEVVQFLKSQSVAPATIDTLMKSQADSRPFIETNEQPLERIRKLVTIATHIIRAAGSRK